MWQSQTSNFTFNKMQNIELEKKIQKLKNLSDTQMHAIHHPPFHSIFGSVIC